MMGWGSGYGQGDGHGSGWGSGDGYGWGSGNGWGSGDGWGEGYAHGYGWGSGHGQGEGNGVGYGERSRTAYKPARYVVLGDQRTNALGTLRVVRIETLQAHGQAPTVTITWTDGQTTRQEDYHPDDPIHDIHLQ